MHSPLTGSLDLWPVSFALYPVGVHHVLKQIDHGKATKILRDPEVQQALTAIKASGDHSDRKLLVFQEGFIAAEDLYEAKENGEPNFDDQTPSSRTNFSVCCIYK